MRISRGWKALSVLALALVACRSTGPLAPAATTAPTAGPTEQRPSPQQTFLIENELVRQLRGGGFVIYIRHAATVPASDTDPQNLANCAAQRNLSDEGREQARRIGNSLRQLGIPVGRVLSSAFCRTVETATLAFGRAEQSVDLTSLPQAGTEAEEERRVSALRDLLSTAPPPGQNTVLVAHLFNIQRAARVSIAEGEAAVFQPTGGGFRLVATVTADEWATLAG